MTDDTDRRPLHEVMTDSYEYFDDTGATYRVIEFEDGYKYDRFVIRFDVDDDVPHQLRIFTDGSDDPAEKIAFQSRDVRFSPISVIGKGESSDLQGVSPTIDSYSDIPCMAQEAWKAIGFSVVPEGDEWSV